MGFRGCVRTGRETAGPSTSVRSGLTWERHRRGTHVFLNQSAAVKERLLSWDSAITHTPQGRLRITVLATPATQLYSGKQSPGPT